MDKHLLLYVQFLQNKHLFILRTEYVFRMILANLAINSPQNSHPFVLSVRWNPNFYVIVLSSWASREREMVQAVSCRLLTAEAYVQSSVNSLRFVENKVAPEQVFP